ncbi:MAG: hypothetical protein AAB606_04695, partial [Patescibacteria group bacterium]
MKPLLFTTWNNTNSWLLVSAFIALLAAVIIHFSIRSRPWMRGVRSYVGSFKNWTPTVLRVLTGLVLFLGSFARFLFAPELTSTIFPVVSERVFLAIQLLAGIMLVIGIFPRFSSLMGLVLYIIAALAYPALNVLPYIAFVGIFVYLILVGDSHLPRVRGGTFFADFADIFELEKFAPYAMAIMRIFTTFSFVLVALFYNMYNSETALSALRTHGVDFNSTIGVSNEVFILFSSVSGILLGVLILFGILPRFVGG